ASGETLGLAVTPSAIPRFHWSVFRPPARLGLLDPDPESRGHTCISQVTELDSNPVRAVHSAGRELAALRALRRDLRRRLRPPLPLGRRPGRQPCRDPRLAGDEP